MNINKLENNHFTNRASYDLAKKLILEGRFEIAKLIIKKRLISNGMNKKHLKLLLLLKIKNISLS